MTRVLEVAAAEDITGHPYSLAITSPEGVTFVKGTCREETRWWADVLQVYSRNKVGLASLVVLTHLHRYESSEMNNLAREWCFGPRPR